MKTKWSCLSVLVLVGSLLISSLGVAEEAENAYEEGVKRIELTPAERESLEFYAKTAKADLEEAMRDAEGKPLAEVNTIYLGVIKQVVAESFFKERRRSELLMRIALNQALELTDGTPNTNGVGVKKDGVLKNTQGSLDLVTSVFEESIRLSLQFYQDDRKAIEGGSLIQLPYIALAQAHLRLGREWLAGVNAQSTKLALSLALLEQWKTTVLQEGELKRNTIATSIRNVVKALKQVSEGSQYSTAQKVRYLRGVMEEVLKIVVEGVPSIHEPELSKTTTGAVFTRDTSNPALGEAWREPNTKEGKPGLIWGDIVKKADGTIHLMNYNEANTYCKGIGARLPEKKDFIRLREYMGARSGTPDYTAPEGYTPQEGLPNLYHWFWSSSVPPDASNDAFNFNGRFGYIFNYNRSNYYYSVRCVAQLR